MVGSLAWPLTTGAVLVLFRAQVRALLSAPIKRVKAGPIEVEWDRQLEAIEQELTRSPEVASAVDAAKLPLPQLKQGSLSALAVIDPYLAITESIHQVEAALISLLHGRGESTDGLGTGALALQAKKLGLISEQTRKAVEGLAGLRYLAKAAGPEGTSSRQALEFIALASAVLFALTASTP
jgi:hypothetical protein